MGDAAETIVNEPKSIRSGSTTIFIAIPTTVRTALRTVFELEKMVFNVVTTGAIVETMLSTTLTIVSTPETIRSGRCLPKNLWFAHCL